MSIPFSGCNSRSGGLISAIAKQLKIINFQPANKITVEFDPFHEKAAVVRQFMTYLSARRYRNTNPKCVLKTNVVCDRSEPSVAIDLDSGEKVVMKCNNLTTLELLKLFNKHITSLVPRPKEEDIVPTKGKKMRKK